MVCGISQSNVPSASCGHQRFSSVTPIRLLGHRARTSFRSKLQVSSVTAPGIVS